MPRLDLDTLDIVCAYVNDVQTVLSFSVTCHALRIIAARRLVAVKPIVLVDERSIRSFHKFLLADRTARSPYAREVFVQIEECDKKTREEVADLFIEILVHLTHLESLRIQCGHKFSECLRDTRIPLTISQLYSLRKLEISGWPDVAEDIVRTARSPLRELHASFDKPLTTDPSNAQWTTVIRLDDLISHLAPTLEVLHLQKKNIKLAGRGAQYPRMRSVHFRGIEGPPWVDVLVHMFPNLCDTLDLGAIDYTLVDAVERQVRARRINKQRQEHASWKGLDCVIGDAISLYMLGLTCPVRRVMVDAVCGHLKEQLATALRDTLPTHLKLTVMLAHGMNAFEDLFPVEVIPKLTHLVLFVTYDNLEDDDRIDRFTLSSVQWHAFLDLVISAIKPLRLTHLRFIVHYNVNLGESITSTPNYSKAFIKNMRELEHSAIASSLMDAVPSLRYVFLSFGGEFDVPSLSTGPGAPDVHNRSSIATRGRWMSSSAWTHSGDEADVMRHPARVGDAAAEKLLTDEALTLSAEDEWTLELDRQWTAEETADWMPPDCKLVSVAVGLQFLIHFIQMGSIIVVNDTNGPMYVFVSSYSNPTGHSDWYNIGPGKRDSWSRDGWELVAFKNEDDTKRAGVYVPVNSTVTYRGLDDITWI
ncbi:hypothetical protein BV20DRAFT_1001746 [Pilatotrama ljubarskyi]|nr:hypothetical protein BV20DRAFT_1001746 [Pilatotrama ljubarskyi]